MEITTAHNIVSVNCEDSSALTSLVIINDVIVVTSFKSNPDVQYVYTMPTTGNIAKLVEMDSAGKFVASFVKPLASFVAKTESGGVATPLVPQPA